MSLYLNYISVAMWRIALRSYL